MGASGWVLVLVVFVALVLAYLLNRVRVWLAGRNIDPRFIDAAVQRQEAYNRRRGDRSSGGRHG